MSDTVERKGLLLYITKRIQHLQQAGEVYIEASNKAGTPIFMDKFNARIRELQALEEFIMHTKEIETNYWIYCSKRTTHNLLDTKF